MPKDEQKICQTRRRPCQRTSFVPPPPSSLPRGGAFLVLLSCRSCQHVWSTSQYIHDVLCAPCGLYGGVMTFQGGLWRARGEGFLQYERVAFPSCRKGCTVRKKVKWSMIMLAHRVGRVLSFFSSRRNWDSPTPLSAGECAPPPFGGGGGVGQTRLWERVWGSSNSD